MQLRYTDVDYDVLTDAAELIARGGSPYGRATYRYTPLLAALLVPGHLLGCPQVWGKLLFCALDTLAAALLGLAASPARDSGASRLVASAVWLLNPFSINISTRGSHEAVICTLLAGCLWALRSRRVVALAVCLGLAVHVRVFPIIFALPLLFHIRHWDEEAAPPSMSSQQQRQSWWMLTKKQWLLGLVCFATFSAVSAVCFAAYGTDFIQHSYLYHLTRTDHRHNLSPYWLHMYLSASSSSTSPPTVVGSMCEKLASFIPQLAALAAIAWRFVCTSGNMESAAFGLWAMVVVFVSFNKVYTVQYFAWWMLLAPLAGLASHGVLRLVRFVLLWIASLALWLILAYRLEFLGEDTMLSMWLAGLLLFGCSVEPVVELCYLKSRLFTTKQTKKD